MTVTTIKAYGVGNHPLNGHRRWGIAPDSYGGYYFYTEAVDRIHSDVIELADKIIQGLGMQSGFQQADELWQSLQEGMIKFITDNHGHAVKYTGLPQVVARPNYNDVVQYLRGDITLAEFTARRGC